MKRLGEKIIEARSKLNLSQAQLARAIGLTPSAVSLIEKNDRNPSLDVLSKIAEVLGVSVSSLVEDIQSPEDTEEQDPKINVLLRGYSDLSDDYKDMLFDYYKLLEERTKKSKNEV